MGHPSGTCKLWVLDEKQRCFYGPHSKTMNGIKSCSTLSRDAKPTNSKMLPTAVSVIAVTASTAFFSANYALSFVAIPAILYSPSPKPNTSIDTTKYTAFNLARQWQTVYNLGHRAGPFTAILAAVLFTYAAAYQEPQPEPTSQILLLTGACLAIVVIPYTLIFMQGHNDELHRRADARSGPITTNSRIKRLIDTDTQTLVEEWARMGVFRASFPLLGAFCGIVALMADSS